MRKRIIISTSWPKLNNIGINRNKGNLCLIDTNCFIGYDHQSKMFVLNKQDTDIILIQDTANLESLTQKGLSFNNADDYFLHHNNENGLLNNQKDIFKDNYIVRGYHENSVRGLYKPVFTIILDNKNGKLNRILEVLGFTDTQINEKAILEAKLNLLHLCLTPNGSKEANKIQNYNLIKETVENVKTDDKSKSIVEYLSEQSDCFHEDYINALTTLRDALLKEY